MPDLFLKIILVLIPLIPLLLALWIAITFVFFKNRLEAGEKLTAKVCLFGFGISFCLLLILDVYALFGLPGLTIVNIGNWLSSGHYNIGISFIVDYKSLTMATLVSFITLNVAKFSVNYLHREAGFQRFFLMLCIFNTAMLLISLSANAVFAFIGWELAGVSSYLLIAYSWHRPIATRNATHAFVTNRIGDAGFIFAIVFSLLWLETLNWQDMSSVVTSKLHIGIILLGFMTAAFAKSAQFPFSGWISRALEGPTPSSAIFYGAIMVHAGVFLLIRLEPLFLQVQTLMNMVILIGGITVIYAYIIGLVQTDVKSAFLFSTLAQVGLMMVWVGLGWFDLALAHIVVHAIWRTYQFLNAPSYMQLVQRTAKPVPKWLRKQTWLHTAALQRFWLDGINDWLLTKPTKSLAKDVVVFENQVVDCLIGTPSETNSLSSISCREAQQKNHFGIKDEIGTGSGMFGRTMEIIASALHSFEENFILKGSGEGLLKGLNYLGKHLESVDRLLTQPRYMIVLIMATFVVVLKSSS